MCLWFPRAGTFSSLLQCHCYQTGHFKPITAFMPSNVQGHLCLRESMDRVTQDIKCTDDAGPCCVQYCGHQEYKNSEKPCWDMGPGTLWAQFDWLTAAVGAAGPPPPRKDSGHMGPVELWWGRVSWAWLSL